MNKYSKIFKHLKRIGKQNDSEYRSDLCLSVSEGRTKSLKELTPVEINLIEKHLFTIGNAVTTPTFEEVSGERMRKKLFGIFRDLGWYVAGKPDYKKINDWIDKHGYLHKPLSRYTNKELPKLITQAETIQRKDYEKNINKD